MLASRRLANSIKESPFFSWMLDPTLRVIYFTSFAFGFTAIAHESNLGATASMIAGDTTTQWGGIIGMTIFGIAFGYLLTSRITSKRMVSGFIWSEILLTLLSGFSVIIGLWAYTNIPNHYIYVIWGTMFLIATMVGIEDALIVRIAEDHAKSLQHSVAFTFFATNIGGGIAGVIFGKLLIPTFGVFDLALVLGLLDGCFVLLNIYYFRNELKRAIVPGALLVLVTGAIMAAYLSGGNITQRMLQPLYNDPIVHVWGDKVGNSDTSSGGKKDILKVLTCERDTCKLFIQGQIQFSTKDEHMYHEPLVHPAMSIVSKRVANRPLNILIAGGGDGLAAREVLKYPNVENVTVIDLDAEMTGVVARSEPLVRFNGDPFSDPRVRIINQDAYVWMRDHADRSFDVVIVDLVDPEDEAVAKLYSLEFYRMVKNRALARGGVIVTQSTSPWYAPRAFWTVNLTMSKVFPTVVPFRWNVPSFGDWGWNIASDIPFDGDSITVDESHTRWLTTDGWKAFLFFGKDEWAVRKELADQGIVSTMLRPAVSLFYKEESAWQDWGEENE